MKNAISLLILIAGGLYFFGFFDTKDDSYQKILNRAPDREQKFIELVAAYVKDTKKADNDLQIAALKTNRTKEICRFFNSGLKVKNWIGKIIDLNSNSDGKGIVKISLAKDITVKTWNNDFSDSGDNTLIEQTAPLFEKALSLKKGDLVRFSGVFISNRKECVRETSITQNGGMAEPEFIFRFSDISLL